MSDDGSGHPAAGLQQALFDRWNGHDAAGYAELFVDDGGLVGFDGSTVEGKKAIEDHLTSIFADHTPASFVGTVREVRALAEDVALVLGVAGMVPPGADDIEPSLNVVQSIVAVERGGAWWIAHFQNTPAALHQDQEGSARLTAELRKLVEQ